MERPTPSLGVAVVVVIGALQATVSAALLLFFSHHCFCRHPLFILPTPSRPSAPWKSIPPSSLGSALEATRTPCRRRPGAAPGGYQHCAVVEALPGLRAAVPATASTVTPADHENEHTGLLSADRARADHRGCNTVPRLHRLREGGRASPPPPPCAARISSPRYPHARRRRRRLLRVPPRVTLFTKGKSRCRCHHCLVCAVVAGHTVCKVLRDCEVRGASPSGYT